jgi:hypothetical protein
MTEVSMIKATCGGCFIKASDTEKLSRLPVIMARKISQRITLEITLRFRPQGSLRKPGNCIAALDLLTLDCGIGDCRSLVA